MSNGGRQYHEQLTHYLRKSFAFNTTGLVSGSQVVWMGTLPPGAIVRGAMIKVHTGFNSATSDVVDVGSVASANGIVASADITVVGGTYSVTGLDFAMTTDPTDIYIKWTGVGTAPSAGSVTVIVEYFANNDL